MAAVSRISVTPVKGTALLHPERIELGPNGFANNRLFHLIDDEGTLVNGKKCGPLVGVRCVYYGGVLSMQFPDGSTVAERVVLAQERTETNFYGRPVGGTVVDGGFAAAVSDFVGRALRLVRVDVPGAGVDVHPVTLISTATLEHLQSEVDAPAAHWADRFRMLLELDGLEPYEEESWGGREVTIGEAVLAMDRLVGRCVVTKQNPRDGSRDFNTLDALQSSRGGLLLGMYATVTKAGTVRRGDVVTVAEPGKDNT
jgi:uncharacterized protein YcbX